jgi:hypothetical protein
MRKQQSKSSQHTLQPQTFLSSITGCNILCLISIGSDNTLDLLPQDVASPLNPTTQSVVDLAVATRPAKSKSAYEVKRSSSPPQQSPAFTVPFKHLRILSSNSQCSCIGFAPCRLRSWVPKAISGLVQSADYSKLPTSSANGFAPASEDSDKWEHTSGNRSRHSIA